MSEKLASFLDDNQEALQSVLEENSGKQTKYQDIGSRLALIVESSSEACQNFMKVWSSYQELCDLRLLDYLLFFGA